MNASYIKKNIYSKVKFCLLSCKKKNRRPSMIQFLDWMQDKGKIVEVHFLPPKEYKQMLRKKKKVMNNKYK